MKRYMTGPQVAARLGVEPVTVRAWRTRGQGPPYTQFAGKGSQVFYDPDVIERYAKMSQGKRRSYATE